MKTIAELNAIAVQQGSLSEQVELLREEIRDRKTKVTELQEEIEALAPIFQKLSQGLEGLQLLSTLSRR